MRKYYTIQTIEAWDVALKKGYLEGDKNYIYDEYFLDSYKWMMSQMRKRLTKYKGEFPIWMWTERPDLRCSGHLARGANGVLLEINIDEKDVLLSDFMAWHCILNNMFLPLNEDEDNLFESGLCNISKEQSWERIFDLDMLRKYGDSQYISNVDKIQGVIGRVEMKNIKLIKRFIAR